MGSHYMHTSASFIFPIFFITIIISPSQLIKANLVSSEDHTVIVEMDHILSSQSPTDRHLDRFQLPAPINNALKYPHIFIFACSSGELLEIYEHVLDSREWAL